MPAPGNRTSAARRRERAIEHRQVLGLEARRAFDRSGLVNVRDDFAGLFGRVAEVHQGLRHGVVDDLDEPAPHELLVLYQRQVRLDAGGVAIHHKADGAGGREHGDLRISVAVLFPKRKRRVPGFLRGQQQSRLDVFGLDRPQRVAVHADNVEHRLAVDGEPRECTQPLGGARRLRVGFAAHQRGDRAGHVAPAFGIVRQRQRHQQRAEIGVAQAERTEIVRILRDLRRGIAGVVHQDFLGRDGDVHGVAEAFHVELAVGPEKLHQVQRGQVASRIVEEHVLAAGVRGVDARGALARVPAVDGGVVLHAGVAAVPGGIGHALEEVARAEFFHGLAVVDVAGPPVAVVFDGLHEFVAHPHGVIGVLEKHGAVGFAVNRTVVALFDEHMSLALLFHLAVDELGDVRVVHVEDHHFRRAPCFPAAFDDAGERVEALHKTHRTGSDAAAGKRFVAAAQAREIRPCARTPFEEHPFGLGQIHDRIHVVLDRIDEAGRALRLGLHADVEPHRGIERHFLLDKQVSQLVAKRIARFRRGEVAALFSPAHDGVRHAADKLPDRSLALVGVGLAVEILAGHDVGGGLRPALGDFHIFLAENDLPFFVADLRGAPLPFDRVERRSLSVGEEPREL